MKRWLCRKKKYILNSCNLARLCLFLCIEMKSQFLYYAVILILNSMSSSQITFKNAGRGNGGRAHFCYKFECVDSGYQLGIPGVPSIQDFAIFSKPEVPPFGNTLPNFFRPKVICVLLHFYLLLRIPVDKFLFVSPPKFIFFI